MATRKQKITSELNAASVVERAKNRELGPVYVLVGNDHAMIDRVFAEMKAAYLTPETEEFSLDVIGADDDAMTAVHIMGAADTVPFMGGTRMVWVRHADALPASELEILGDYIEQAAGREDMLLVLVFSEIDKRMKFAKTVVGMNIVVDCSVKPLGDVAAALRDRYGKQVTPQAAVLLQQRASENPNVAWNEIDKVSLYIGDRDTVTEDDVRNVCLSTVELDEWRIVACVRDGDVAGALRLLQDMRRSGESEVYQHTVVAMALTQLAAACGAMKDGSLHKRMYEFRIGRDTNRTMLEGRLRGLGEDRIKACLRWLMYMDIAVKGSNLPAELLADTACIMAA